MPKQSAGILLFRGSPQVEVFLVHPGGPLWAKKDLGAWSIPKGEFGTDEDPLRAARREFQEEVGTLVEGPFQPLCPVRQASGKVVHAWACRGDCDPATLRSNTFSMEWPPRSGQWQDFPEVDRGAWFSLEEAASRLNAGQVGLLHQLRSHLDGA
jgi:predicted NUDIX family NTP pyrophosphohydrolase